MPNFNNTGYNYPNNYGYNNYNNNNFYQTQNTYTYVKGIEGAKNYQIGANQTVLLIDTDNSILYVKTANALGQVSLQYFSITPIKESDVEKPQVDYTNYASRSDVDALIKRVESLEAKRSTSNGGK